MRERRAGKLPPKHPHPSAPPDLEELLEDLVRIDTSEESARGFSLIEHFCAREGIQTRRFWRSTPHAALLAGKNTTGSPLRVLLVTHLDTVRQVGTPRRKLGTLSGSRLHGRGALDMKAGLAMALCLLRDFSLRTAKNRHPHVDLSVLVTSDEERDSEGAWRFAHKGTTRPDLVLVPEPTWERVAASAYGRRSWMLRFVSKGGHSGGNFQRGANPTAALASAIASLPRECTPVGLATEGEGVVTLPTEACARLEFAFAKRSDLERTETVLSRTLLQTERKHPGVRGSLQLGKRKTPWLDPYMTDPDNPLLISFLKSVKSVTGKAEIITEEAVGDFNVFGTRYPTLIFGPSGEGAHGRDEWVDRRSLGRCWAVYAGFLAGLQT